MSALVRQLGRTAFHIVNGTRVPGFARHNTLGRFEGLLLDIQEDPEACALFRSLVPEHDPTPHDVARGLADLVPLRFQLREDDASGFSPDQAHWPSLLRVVTKPVSKGCRGWQRHSPSLVLTIWCTTCVVGTVGQSGISERTIKCLEF